MAQYRVPNILGFEWQKAVLDKDLATPPASPNEGDRYLIASGATDAWAGHDGDITWYENGAWYFIPKKEGMFVYVKDEDQLYYYNGSAWNVFSSGTGGADSDWTIGDGVIYNTTDKVGIGTDNPGDSVLKVEASSDVGWDSYHGHVEIDAKGYGGHALSVTSDTRDLAILLHTTSGDAQYRCPRLMFKKARGSKSSPTAILDNDVIGKIRAMGYDGSAYTSVSEVGIEFRADGDWDTSHHGQKILFRTLYGADDIAKDSLILHGSGIASFPNQSACFVKPSADFSVPTNTFVKVPCDTVIYDAQGEYNSSTYRYTVSKDGIYLVSLNVWFKNMTSNKWMVCAIYINGNREFERQIGTTPGYSMSVQGTGFFKLSAGDYIEPYVYHNTGNTETGEGARTRFYIFKVA